MQKGVLTGLFLLIVIVFAYVGYTSYTTRRPTPDPYTDGMSGNRSRGDAKAETTGASPSSSTLPVMPSTGTSNPDGLVAQGGSSAASTGFAPPASDTIAANPPNGMRFGGSGHYQLYRQGDLTWRLDTDTGQTCIIFATDEEWRKPKVYQAGCRGK